MRRQTPRLHAVSSEVYLFPLECRLCVSDRAESWRKSQPIGGYSTRQAFAYVDFQISLSASMFGGRELNQSTRSNPRLGEILMQRHVALVAFSLGVHAKPIQARFLSLPKTYILDIQG